MFFSVHIPKVGGKVAPANVAKRFSIESTFHDNPLANHICRGTLAGGALNIGSNRWLRNRTAVKLLARSCPNWDDCAPGTWEATHAADAAEQQRKAVQAPRKAKPPRAEARSAGREGAAEQESARRCASLVGWA